MNALQTSRFSIPLLAAGQAHKELFHNEALTLIDFLFHPVVEGIENDPQSLAPLEGQSWLIGPAPLGDWAGLQNNLAGWSGGGWRYIVPIESMQVIVANETRFSVFSGGNWQSVDNIVAPTGGQTVDQEARGVIDSILTALQTHGILPNQV